MASARSGKGIFDPMDMHLTFFAMPSWMDIWSIQVPLPILMALAAALGYIVSRWKREASRAAVRSRQDLQRARTVAKELERISRVLRRNLARHHASLSRFKRRIGELDGDQQEMGWHELCREWEELLLAPASRLAAQIGQGYDEIRQQINRLTMLTEARTDPLTGVSNRRGLDESLLEQFALMARYQLRFSVALFDVDHFKRVNDEQGHLNGDRMLQGLAQRIDQQARETDIVGRFGGEEFVVIMPQTDLAGACVFAERLRARIAQELSITISGGVAAAVPGDDPQTLMARADRALYAAKSAGRDRVFYDDGQHTESAVATALEASRIAQAGVEPLVAEGASADA